MGVQYNTIENVPVASFETSWKNESANQPIKSVVAEITPTQDLHGYDYPWPAGGGKNLLPCGEAFDVTRNGIVFTSNGNGTYTVKGTAENVASYKFPIAETVLPNEVYVHLGNNAINGNFSLSFFHNYTNIVYFAPVTSINRILRSPSLDNQTVNGLQLYVVKDATIDLTISPMIMTVSTATSFTPYSNICPITGRTEATVTRAGKNLFDYTRLQSGNGLTVTISQTGTVSVSGVLTRETGFLCRYDITDLLQDGTYTLSQSQFFGAQLYSEVLSRNKDGTISYYGCANVLSKNIPVDKSLVDAYEIYVVAKKSAWGEESKTLSCTFQLEKGSTATSFAPYSGTSYPVSWQSEAGTVYGGTVDVVSGVLTVDMVEVDLGTLNWSMSSTNIFMSSKPSPAIYEPDRNEVAILCDRLNPVKYSALGTNDFCICSIFGGVTASGTFWAKASSYPDAASFKAAMSGAQCVSKLATPQTYQLSGQQIIKTLLGQNNVWADSGNIKKLMWQYTIFDLLRVFINGFEITDFIAFGGWQRERGDVDGPEAGRTLDARMHRARVATKMRYNVTCRPLLVEELSSLERLIMPEYVTVKVIGDPYYGTWEKTCYVNNTSSQYLIRKRNGAQWWGGITFPIIEV